MTVYILKFIFFQPVFMVKKKDAPEYPVDSKQEH